MDQVRLRSSDMIDDVYKQYANTVYRLAFSRTKRSNDADDILQEVFLKYIKSDMVFQSEEHRKAWLIRVTINCSKNLLMSAWIKKTTMLNDELMTTLQDESDVYQYVLQLPTKYRTVIHLYYYEELSTAEIAKTLEVKESTIRTWLHRARNQLKEKMKGDEAFEF